MKRFQHEFKKNFFMLYNKSRGVRNHVESQVTKEPIIKQVVRVYL